MVESLYNKSVRQNVLVLVSLTWFAIAVCIGCRLRWLLPFLQPLPLYPLFYRTVQDGEWNETLHYLLTWVLVSILTVTALTTLFPSRTADTVLNGNAFRQDMFSWLQTGEGSTGDPRLFLPMHVRDFSLFVAASVASAGALGLVWGTTLLNAMSFYFGSLLGNATQPLVVLFFGWPVWSIFRVIGFCLCGVAVSGVLPSWMRRTKIDRRKTLAYLASGLALVVADGLLKWQFAPMWRDVLRKALGLWP